MFDSGKNNKQHNHGNKAAAPERERERERQRERERESFIRNNLHNGVVSGAARGQALLGPIWTDSPSP
jgi:hypothetical protein